MVLSPVNPLHQAIKEHLSTTEIKKMIASGLDINNQDQNLQTPLHIATSLGNLEIVQLLIASPVDINAQDNNKNTPLHCLFDECLFDKSDSKATRVQILKLLLEKGANVHLEEARGLTPLRVALNKWSTYECDEVVELFLKYGATRNGLLFRVSDQWKKRLIELGEDVNTIGPEGRSLLHNALYHIQYAANGPGASSFSRKEPIYAERINWLISAGIKIDTRCPQGTSPLYYAIDMYCASSWVLNKLLECGADPNFACGSHDKTPLCYTIDCSSIDVQREQVIDLLLSYGADINATDNRGFTPLRYALIWVGYPEPIRYQLELTKVKLLLARGANTNIPDTYLDFEDAKYPYIKMTPLHVAVVETKPDLVRLLLDFGANPNLKCLTKEGKWVTPLYLTSNDAMEYRYRYYFEKFPTKYSTAEKRLREQAYGEQAQWPTIAKMLVDAGGTL